MLTAVAEPARIRLPPLGSRGIPPKAKAVAPVLLKVSVCVDPIKLQMAIAPGFGPDVLMVPPRLPAKVVFELGVANVTPPMKVGRLPDTALNVMVSDPTMVREP